MAQGPSILRAQERKGRVKDDILDALDDLARQLGLLQTEVARIKRLIKEEEVNETPTVRPPSQANIAAVRLSKKPPK
jgi:hypothetical protein